MAKATSIQTVLGPLPTTQLGRTFSHEHVLIAPTGYESDPNLEFDYETMLLQGVNLMKELKETGIASIIDPAPMDLGRRVEFLADVAEGSGMNIICSTGVYFESGPFAGLPTYYKSRRPEELESIFRREIEDGAGSRKIRPGVIKCATSAFEITESEAKALSAAARASKTTNTRITTHTQEGTMGQEQLNLFENEGVPPHHVTIGHCSDSKDMEYLASIAKRGAYIGFDRVGIEAWVSDDIKLGVIAGLVAMGLARHIVLSHDNVGCSHAPRSTRRPPDPKRRFTLIHEEFIPAMKGAGISETTIEMMLVDNIRRFFEGAEPP